LKAADNVDGLIEGFAGCKLWAPRVILVATHADLACKDHGGVQSDPEGLVTELQRRYETDLIIEPHMFVVDSSTTSSSEMNALKRALGDIKKFICEVSAFVGYCIR